MDFHISKADERHRQAIDRLLRKTRIGHLQKNQKIRNFWIVRDAGRVIACAGMDFYGKTAAVFTYLAVEHSHRHRGIGSVLVNHRLAVVRKKGVKLLGLVTMYYLFNFYKKWEFATCPRKDLPDGIRNYPMFTAPCYKKCAVMIRHL